MNKNSMRDVTMYYAHDYLGYTAPELAKVYGISAVSIRRIISRVRKVESGEITHGPTAFALKQMKRNYPTHNMEFIKVLRAFVNRINEQIISFASTNAAYYPEVKDLSFYHDLLYISDTLGELQEDIAASLKGFLSSDLAD